MVSVMQEELVALQPQLVKTQQDVSEMMIQISRDKVSAAETKQQVEVEEANANIKANDAKAIGKFSNSSKSISHHNHLPRI